MPILNFTIIKFNVTGKIKLGIHNWGSPLQNPSSLLLLILQDEAVEGIWDHKGCWYSAFFFSTTDYITDSNLYELFQIWRFLGWVCVYVCVPPPHPSHQPTSLLSQMVQIKLKPLPPVHLNFLENQHVSFSFCKCCCRLGGRCRKMHKKKQNFMNFFENLVSKC